MGYVKIVTVTTIIFMDAISTSKTNFMLPGLRSHYADFYRHTNFLCFAIKKTYGICKFRFYIIQSIIRHIITAEEILNRR